ncbi:hypothetical protein VIBNIAM115_1200089 [Vibrio nigripulchritudo AM115]|nr:hypothetical protein VIBNIAM115_1200089 [Vibrio nigripulchritudo AM115]
MLTHDIYAYTHIYVYLVTLMILE